MDINTLPETDDEIEEFIRQCESGEIPEPPPFNSSKLLARMCVMQTRIDKLEAECTRLHGHWHGAEVKANHAKSALTTAEAAIHAIGGWEGTLSEIRKALQILGQNAIGEARADSAAPLPTTTL